MLNREIKQLIARNVRDTAFITLAISAPIFFFSGMGFRAHTQRDREESARIEADGAVKGYYQSMTDKMLQDARDKINKSRRNK